MTLRIGRKTYTIEAVIAAVPTPIFGWDIFKKYRLSLDWDDNGNLIIVDKKANISSKLSHELVEAGSIPRVKNATQDVAAALFEFQCMKKLDMIKIRIDTMILL